MEGRAVLAGATTSADAKPSAVATAATTPPAVTFTDVTAAAGIRFTHNSGRAGKKYLPETMGAGAAFFDADGDGWLDVLLINGRDWQPGKRRSLPALYRNRGDGTFEDVTAGSGLDVELYGLGVAVGDYDNDGRDDVYVTALEGDRLFHNEGSGKFSDVTAAAGIRNASFGTSAAWLDYDKDGRIDLFVANYVQWSAEKDQRCSLDGATKSYCTPEVYPGAASKLYRNLGGGRFADVSAKAGIADPTSKSLAVAVLDFDGDGWPDLFVANDTRPNRLYRNRGDGTFVDRALEAGVAFSDDGVARGAMGADAADYDRSGRPHLVVANFSNEMLGLYHNEDGGHFTDRAPGSAVGRESLLALSFGIFFFDYDLDGWPDLFVANGHIEEGITRVQPQVQYRQPPLLLAQPGRRPLRAGGRRRRPGPRPPHRRPRRRLRRLRPRRRSRRPGHHQRRPRPPLPQRRRQPQPLVAGEDRRPPLQPRRPRGGGAGDLRLRHPVGHRPQRLLLLLAERDGLDLRPRPRRQDRGPGSGVAQRYPAAIQRPRRRPGGDGGRGDGDRPSGG